MKTYLFIPLLVAGVVITTVCSCEKEDPIIDDKISAVIERIPYKSIPQKSSDYDAPIDYRELSEGGFSLTLNADMNSRDREFGVYINISDDEPIQPGIRYQAINGLLAYDYSIKKKDGVKHYSIFFGITSGWIEFTEITASSLKGKFEMECFRWPNVMPTRLEALGLDSYISLTDGSFGPIRVSSKITKHLGGE